MKRFQSLKNQNGFTLIELLVVIGILAILLAITLIAINPNKHFQDTRNAKRSSDVSAILDAIYEFESSNNGSQPPSVTGVTTAVALGAVAAQHPTSTDASGNPALVFSGLSGNTITSGTVTVTGCANAANNGSFPVTGGTGTTLTVTNVAGVDSDTTCVISGWSNRVDICTDVVPTYLANLPMDPAATGTACTATYDTGYEIAKTASGRFTISAPDAEGTATISVTR